MQCTLSENKSVASGSADVNSPQREQRNGAQAFINGNCHGLQQCNGATPCNVAFARGQLANQCAHARFTVRSYYIERDIPDPGNHQGAIVWDDNVAQSCLAQVQSPRCQVRG